MWVDVPGDATVIRFLPMLAPELRNKAEKAYLHFERWQLSVFACTRRDGESVEEQHDRLLDAAELHRINLPNNPEYYVCPRARTLLDLGFSFHDGDIGAPAAHYGVDIGRGGRLTSAGLSDFIAAFEPRQNPRSRP